MTSYTNEESQCEYLTYSTDLYVSLVTFQNTVLHQMLSPNFIRSHITNFLKKKDYMYKKN